MKRVNVMVEHKDEYKIYSTDSYNEFEMFGQKWHVTHKRNPEDGTPFLVEGNKVYVVTHGTTGWCMPGVEAVTIDGAIRAGKVVLEHHGEEYVMSVINAVKESQGAPRT
jgi:hypothetical protein